MLEKARESDKKSPRSIGISQEHFDLAWAYISREVRLSQVIRALGFTPTSNAKAERVVSLALAWGVSNGILKRVDGKRVE